MSLDLIVAPELAPYDDDEEILFMDDDGRNLQLEEQSINTNTNIINQKEQEETNNNDQIDHKQNTIPSLLVIEKLKVYIRDEPNHHHVEVISTDNKYYELPTIEELSSINLTDENVKDIWQSLNLTKENFRSSSSINGTSRPESLYIHGVNKMSTQDILNCFEDFQPIGIEWICDFSCNVFWYDTLNPLKLLSTMTVSGPCKSHRGSANYDHSVRLSKRKLSSLITDDDDDDSVDSSLPPGHWRQGDFHSFEKPEITHQFYLRYTMIDDRKLRGAENQSKYYRKYGNPNYNNMTGLISRSKKRQLNAMKSNRFKDFTVVRSNDPTSTSNSVVEETATTEDNTTDPNVKFTVVLPPKSSSTDKDKEQDDDDDDDYEREHKSKRQRRQRSWDDDDDDRKRKEKTHFTVTIDSISKHRKDKFDDNSKSNHENDELEPITDARQILERKRRNRR